MKRKVIFFGLLILCLACEKDTPPELISVSGWSLHNVSGGIAGINIDYSTQDVIWSFSENGKLSVENKVISTGAEQIHAGFSSGDYTYSIVESGNVEILMVDSVEVGILKITQGSLTLDDNLAADGFLKTFLRHSQ